MNLPELSFFDISLYLLVLGLFYLIALALYRRYLHPLSGIPGPFLFTVTRLCLWYHNVMREGQLYLEIEKLHRTYGPVVRVSPNEVHLNDPEHYETIYSHNGKYTKDPAFYVGFGLDRNAMFVAYTENAHRVRRAPLNPFFSRRAVLDLEEIVQDKVSKLLQRLQEDTNNGKPFDIGSAYKAISIDVISTYAFDECWDQLERDDLGSWYEDVIRTIAGPVLFTLQQWPFLIKPLLSMPDAIASKMDPAMAGLLFMQQRCRGHVKRVQLGLDSGQKPRRKTIFHTLLDTTENGGMGAKDPLIREALTSEGQTMLQAAADTTGNALTVATLGVLSQPQVYATLVEELHRAFPEPDTRLKTTALEKLPYLSGVVKEALRLSYGVISRLPRVVPDGGATFNGVFIPGKKVVSMDAWTMHRCPRAFPDPDRFDPTRWLDPDTEAVRYRERLLVPFSRGARMCIGQELAKCQLHLILGTVFHRRHDLEIWNFNFQDQPQWVEVFIPMRPKGTKKFNVVGTKGGIESQSGSLPRP